MLFLRRLATGFVVSFFLWIGLSIGALAIGGALSGAIAAQEQHATDYQSGYAAGHAAGREFGLHYGKPIIWSALAVSIGLAVWISFALFLPWCQANANQVAHGRPVLDRLTAGVLICLVWAAIFVFILAALRRHGGQADIALPQPTASPVGPLASFNPQAVRDAKKEAVQLYPELAVAGSRMNAEYVARYDRYRLQNPSYFLDTNWPLTLANETAAAMSQGGTLTAPASPSPTVSATAPATANSN